MNFNHLLNMLRIGSWNSDCIAMMAPITACVSMDKGLCQCLMKIQNLDEKLAESQTDELMAGAEEKQLGGTCYSLMECNQY